MKASVLFIFGLLGCYDVIHAGTIPKPNVVIMIADDISSNDFGCYGHPVIKTPNIDQLAANGMRFTNTYLTASSCSPSRVSIITGRYPHNTGAAELHSVMPKNQVPFPRLLREAGYYTAQSGKWHFGSQVPVPGDAMEGAFEETGEHNVDEGGVSGAEEWVDCLRERPRNQPFFMWFAAFDAHRPWDKELAPVHYKPAEVIVPSYLVDTEETRLDLADYYKEVSRFDYFVGKVVAELKAQAVLENTMIIIMADNGRAFPYSKTRLYDEGINTPFVIHWPQGIKSKLQVCSSLVSTIDIAPTVLEAADVNSIPPIQGKSFMELLANPKQPFRQYVFAEHNWHDFKAYERMVRHGRFVLIENRLPDLDNRGALDIISGDAGKALNHAFQAGTLTPLQARSFLIPQPEYELYDCATDPLQTSNLAFSAGYSETKIQLQRILQRWKRDTHDSFPDSLTADWYDREQGNPLDEQDIRGVMPGSDKQATSVTNSGPF